MGFARWSGGVAGGGIVRGAICVVAIAAVWFGAVPVARARGPKGPEAAEKLKAEADALKAQGRLEEALKYYREAAEADPGNLGNLEEYGKALFTTSHFKEAAALFRNLTSRDDPAAWWNLGYALRKTGDYAGAADAYENYEKANPDDPDAYYQLAECYRALQRYADAAAQYDLYVQKENRPDQQKFVEKAKAKSAQMKAAVNAPTVIAMPGAQPVQAAPDQAAPATPAGGVVVAMPGAAPAPVSPAADMRDPNAAIGKIREGDGLFKQGRYREALAAYQEALRLDDQSTNALLKEGLSFANMSYFKEAVEAWNRVLQIEPGNAWATRYIAKAKPRVDPNQVPFDPNAQAPVAASSAIGGTVITTSAAAPAQNVDEAGAKEYYRKAVQLMRAQQFDDAIVTLNGALQKNPRYANAYIARGGAYFGIRRYAESVADYQKAAELAPSLATPVYGLARAYERLGDKANACEQYRRYASSYAEDVQAALKQQAQKQLTTLCAQ